MSLKEACAYAALLREHRGAGSRVSVHLKRVAGMIPSWFIRVTGELGRDRAREFHTSYAVERALDEAQ